MSDAIRVSQVKTRKPHRCWGCAIMYPAGSAMESAPTPDDGTVYTVYWCETCQAYIQQHYSYGDECGYGELRGNDPEEWARIYADIEAAKGSK